MGYEQAWLVELKKPFNRKELAFKLEIKKSEIFL